MRRILTYYRLKLKFLKLIWRRRLNITHRRSEVDQVEHFDTGNILGYDVVSRTSPIEALELNKAKPTGFDLVISDQTMPGMQGIVLASELMKIKSGYSCHNLHRIQSEDRPDQGRKEED